MQEVCLTPLKHELPKNGAPPSSRFWSLVSLEIVSLLSSSVLANFNFFILRDLKSELMVKRLVNSIIKKAISRTKYKTFTGIDKIYLVSERFSVTT
jgi:hypothetical protein